MNLTHVNIVLSVLLLVSAALAASLNVDHEQPNVEFLPEMKRSVASQAYSANAVLPHGRTLQPPVAGTIARGDLPLYYTATKEDAERAGEELVNPFFASIVAAAPAEPASPSAAGGPDSRTLAPPVDPNAVFNASVQRGARVYGIFCVSCHGASGAGDGPVAKRGFPPPPPLTTGKSAQMKDGQLFHIVTYGQGSMSPLASQLPRNQRWDVINYVRSLQQGSAQSRPAVAPVVPDQSADDSAEEAASQEDTELPSSDDQEKQS